MPKSRRKGRSGSVSGRRFRGLLFTAAALGLVAAVLALVYLLPVPYRPGRDVRPPFEEPPPPPRTAPAAPPPSRNLESPPLVALLIDDLGHDLALDRAFLGLEAPLSFAFLPGAPHTRRLALEARQKGRDVLVHLPMEPMSAAVDPGPGALRSDMGLATLLRLLREDLDGVPGAVGVNNHMGSRLTAEPQAMEWVLAEVKRRGLFFVDSRTTSTTVAWQTAHSLGVPALERTVFLDHDTRPDAVKSELRRLVRLARERGQALAIAHPSPITLKVLYEELPNLQKEVTIVAAHRLLLPDDGKRDR